MAIQDLTFDDLIPEKKKPGLNFDDLIPKQESAAGLAKTAASAVPKAIAGMFGLAGDLAPEQLANWLSQKVTGRSKEDVQAAMDKPALDWLPNSLLPTSTGVRKQMERVTGPLYEPQTRAEKALDTGVQLTVGLGKPSISTLGKVVLPATAGTEMAGMATDDNPLARAGGGLLGGGVAALANAYTSIPGNTIRQAVGDISLEQIAAALQRQAGGKSVGVPLMGAESLPNSGIQQLAADVMASRTGAPVVRNFLEQRPGQVKQAVTGAGGLLGRIAPEMTPEASAALAQEAATKAVRAAESARTAATSPYYNAARSDVVGPDVLYGIEQSLRNQKPFFELPAQQSAIDGYLKLLQPKQGMNAIAMDNLYKSARDDVNIAQIGATSADKQAAAVLRPLAPELKAGSELTSPALKAGRALHEQITRDVVDPLVSGPVGRVAGMKSGGFDPATSPPVQRATSEISNAQQARPETIRELYTNLNKQDKAAFPAVARTYLENAFDVATKEVQTGQNVKLGANFYNSVLGTDRQKQNFDEILRGVADANSKNPVALIKGAKVLMDTLSSTGKIPGTGSQTATRLGTQTELSRNPVSAASDILSTRPLAMFARGAESLFNARRNKIIAEWLTAPDSVEIITRMAKLKPDGITARFYAAQLLNSRKELSESAQ